MKNIKREIRKITGVNIGMIQIDLEKRVDTDLLPRQVGNVWYGMMSKVFDPISRVIRNNLGGSFHQTDRWET